VVAVQHCLNKIQEMVSFFKYAKRNSHLVKVIKQSSQGSNKDAEHLVSLCQTRFAERHKAVLVTRQLLPSVVKALEDMVMWDSLETRKNARRLLSSIQKAEFLITLITCEQVSSLLRPETLIYVAYCILLLLSLYYVLIYSAAKLTVC